MYSTATLREFRRRYACQNLEVAFFDLKFKSSNASWLRPQPYAVGGQTFSLMANMGVSMSGWFDGKDRYDTANKLVNWSVWRGGDTVMVAVGTNFADALAAGPLAASTGQLLVLANPSSAVLKVPAGVKNLVFIGGEGANPDKYAVVN